MSRRELSRTINDGGRMDPNSKMYGGIAFSGNSTVTVLANTNPTRIISTPAYTVLLPTTYTNPYWELVGATTPVQTLQYLGSRAALTVHWGVTIEAAAAADMQVRLMKQGDGDPAPLPVAIMTELSSVSVAGFNIPARYSTILFVDHLDQFYIDIANLTAGANVTVTSSQIVFTQ